MRKMRTLQMYKKNAATAWKNILWQSSFYFQCVYKQNEESKNVYFHWSEMIREIKRKLWKVLGKWKVVYNTRTCFFLVISFFFSTAHWNLSAIFLHSIQKRKRRKKLIQKSTHRHHKRHIMNVVKPYVYMQEQKKKKKKQFNHRVKRSILL